MSVSVCFFDFRSVLIPSYQSYFEQRVETLEELPQVAIQLQQSVFGS